MFLINQKKKDKGLFCCAHSCKNKPIKRKGMLCHKHYARKIREQDPVQSRYNQFKGNAKKRKRPLHITIDEFRMFCKRTGYILKKGNRGQNATIDRRCNAHGYYIWNIQLLTNRQNARKGNRFNGSNFSNPNKPSLSLNQIINSTDHSQELPF